LYPHGPDHLDEEHLRAAWVEATWKRDDFVRVWQRLSAEERARITELLGLRDGNGEEEAL
jgi:hypothetical protein